MAGLEPFVVSAISSIALPIFQSMWEGGGKILGLFGKSLDEKTKQLIFNASGQYVQNYTERHGILKVLGMREPKSLESLYTAVHFLAEEELYSLESVENLEEAYRQSKYRSFQSRTRTQHSGLKVANEKQFLMVLGGPGTGKSTFLRRTGLEVLKGRKGDFQHRCIPVLIELKEFRSGKIDIKNKISEEFRICGFPEHHKFTAKALEQGQLLVLLDGLDEIPTERTDETIRQIQNFVDLYDKNRFIASCRLAARHNFRRFTDVVMAEFDDQKIKTFINNWFSTNLSVGQDCWKKLNGLENSAAKELTHTPLLLTLICLLYQRARKFPSNRATLYEKALRVLLEEWAGEKGLPQEEIYRGLDTRLKETLLSEIAYNAFKEDRLFLPRREVSEQIEEFLEEVLIDERIDGKAVLKSIEVQHGVFVERAEGIYSFSHLTLQEYLTAQYIDDHRQLDSFVDRHLTDSRWREVFLLVAGLMRGGADELLLAMEKKTQSYIKVPLVADLLRWSGQITTDSEKNYVPAAKRTFAILFYIAISLAFDRAATRSLSLHRANASAIAIHRDRALELEHHLHIALDLIYTLDIDLYRAIGRVIDRASDFAYTIDRTKRNGLNLARRHTDSNVSDRVNALTYILDVALSPDLVHDRDLALNLNLNLAQGIAQINVFQSTNLVELISKFEAVEKTERAETIKSRKEVRFRKRGISQEQIQQIWFKELQIISDQLNFSQNEAKALKNYLSTNRFILQCDKSAVRVSRKTRALIIERMLLPVI